MSFFRRSVRHAGKKWESYREQFYFVLHRLPSIELNSIIATEEQLTDAVIDDHICLPPIESSWITDKGVCVQPRHDDVTPLMQITKYISPKIVIEFGTGYGNLTANICRWSRAHVFTVNALPDQISGINTTYSLEKELIGLVYRKYGYQNRVTQIYENTLNLDLSYYFNDPCIDLAVIDACHDEEYVRNDFTKIAPWIRRDGMVLLHDTHPGMHGHLKGSYAACLYLRKHFDIKHIKNTWWAFWTN